MKIKITVLACIVAAALLLPMSGCGSAAPTADKETGAETTPREQTTVDLTDDRTIADMSAYEAGFTDAFAAAAPVPEADVTYTVTDSGAAVTGYTGDKSVVVIPDTLGGLPVTSVAEGAFVESAIEALSLPDTVTDVAFGALAKCDSLSVLRTPVIACADKPWLGALFGSTTYEINRANVPNSLTTLIVGGAPASVPDYCFYGCSELEAVSLPAGLKEVGAFAFYGCDRLVCVSLPEGVETVGEYAFGNCLALASLTLPASVTRMGRSMLEGCGALTDLTVPFVGETADGENNWLAFLFGAADHTFSEGYMPASLVRVTVLNGTTLPRNAFYECSHIREVVLPETMTAVGDRAFYRCAYLSAITLPVSVTALGNEAFSGCVRLCSIDLRHITDFGVQTFRGCLSLTDVTTAASAVIPEGTFAGTPFGEAK